SIEPPKETTSRSLELPNLPPEAGQTYPVNLLFSRRVSYADRKGRMVHADVIVTLGMTIERWQRESPGPAPGWERLRGVAADAATAWVTFDGSSMTGQRYVGYASADAANLSVDGIVAALKSPAGSEGPTFPAPQFVDDKTGAGYHFDLLIGWLDAIDEQRAEAARVHHAWYARPFLAIGGALYAFGNLFVEAAKQLW